MAFNYVVLVWGDSGVGTANTTQAVPAHLQTADSGIKIWTGSAFATLVNGTNNNTLSAVQTANWGLEAEWAYQWRQHFPTLPINIIKLWAGSAKINNFNPGGAQYTQFKTNTTAALATLANPVVVASLSWVGWTDGNSSGDATAYQARCELQVTNSKLEMGCTDATRQIVGLVETPAGWTMPPFTSNIRAAQAAFCAVDPASRKTVETTGYSYQADNNGHPSAAGNVSAGQDFFNAYLACKKWGAKWVA